MIEEDGIDDKELALRCSSSDFGNPYKDPVQIRKRKKLQMAMQAKWVGLAESEQELINK